VVAFSIPKKRGETMIMEPVGIYTNLIVEILHVGFVNVDTLYDIINEKENVSKQDFCAALSRLGVRCIELHKGKKKLMLAFRPEIVFDKYGR
jgi:hypothetical protein